MRIHSDVLATNDLYAAVPEGCYLEVSRHGSRKRVHAFEVGMGAEPGSDKHGIKRAYARNTGQYGGGRFYRAATWIEWGDWMVSLFKKDPSAIIGYYDGAEDFRFQTKRASQWRHEREHAPEHAERWRIELRLEEIRRELRDESLSYGELAELQELAAHIDPSDVELLQAAGVPEHV